MGEESKQEQVKAEPKLEEKAPAAEEKKDKKAETEEEKKQEEEKKEEEPKPPSPCILYVDLHCVGCAKKIEKHILKIRGVEGVMIDMAQNQVTLKGIVDPQAVCNVIMKKTKRRAKVLSPLPPAEGEPVPQVVSSQVSGSTTVELNVNMHCEACAEQLKRKILKMRGVQTAATELASGKVTVTGTMDPEKLVEYVYRRTKKQARIVPQPEPEPEKQEPKEGEKPADANPAAAEEKKEENGEKKEGENEKPPEEAKKEEGEGKEAGPNDGAEEKVEEVEVMMSNEEESLKRMIYYYEPLYVIEKMPAPQLFSDENPNACCIA